MTLKSDTKFEEKLTRGLENDIRNSANSHQSIRNSRKLGLLCDPFIPSGTCTSLKFTGELFVMTMQNHTKFKEELTCHFKIDLRTLTNFNLNI